MPNPQVPRRPMIELMRKNFDYGNRVLFGDSKGAVTRAGVNNNKRSNLPLSVNLNLNLNIFPLSMPQISNFYICLSFLYRFVGIRKLL